MISGTALGTTLPHFVFVMVVLPLFYSQVRKLSLRRIKVSFLALMI